jgi:hypothetical protein
MSTLFLYLNWSSIFPTTVNNGDFNIYPFWDLLEKLIHETSELNGRAREGRTKAPTGAIINKISFFNV